MDSVSQPIIPTEVAAVAYPRLMEHESLPRYVMDGDKFAYTMSPYKEGEVSYFPVYDDQNWKNAWDPATGGYDAWHGKLKGKPTLGYGMRYDLLSQAMRDEYTQANGYVGIDWIKKGLSRRASDIMNVVYKRLPGIRKMSPEQQAALISFYYNTGPASKNKDTIEAAIKNKDYNGIYNALPLYNKAGGKVHNGLKSRREAERKYFSPDYIKQLQQRAAESKSKQLTQQTAAPSQAQVPSTVPAAAATSSAEQLQPDNTYKVRSGDSVYKLWKSRKDKKTSWQTFLNDMRKNNPGINFDTMRPGTTLKLNKEAQ